MIFHTHTFQQVSLEPEAFLFKGGLLFKIESDIKARCIWYRGACGKGMILRSLFHEGLMATVLLRIAEAESRSPLTKPFAWITYRMLKAFCHMTVGCGASFGPGIVLLHPFGVFSHKTVVAGNNLVLQNSITLGGEDDNGPQIGNNVFVGVGARIIGPISIGDRCRIGANSVVTVSIKADHVAAGNPARQIPIQPVAANPQSRDQ
jgi:serine O-acetyltransferase